MLLRTLLVTGLVVSAACANDSPTATAHRIEERLVAPCCWKGTLRDHSSDLAISLRSEIDRRVGAGESAAAIEDDFVARYGEKIRALPKDRDPRWMIVAGFAALAAAGLFVLTRVRRAQGASDTSASKGDDAYSTRLDDELAAID